MPSLSRLPPAPPVPARPAALALPRPPSAQRLPSRVPPPLPAPQRRRRLQLLCRPGADLACGLLPGGPGQPHAGEGRWGRSGGGHRWHAGEGRVRSTRRQAGGPRRWPGSQGCAGVPWECQSWQGGDAQGSAAAAALRTGSSVTRLGARRRATEPVHLPRAPLPLAVLRRSACWPPPALHPRPVGPLPCFVLQCSLTPADIIPLLTFRLPFAMLCAAVRADPRRPLHAQDQRGDCGRGGPPGVARPCPARHTFLLLLLLALPIGRLVARHACLLIAPPRAATSSAGPDFDSSVAGHDMQSPPAHPAARPWAGGLAAGSGLVPAPARTAPAPCLSCAARFRPNRPSGPGPPLPPVCRSSGCSPRPRTSPCSGRAW